MGESWYGYFADPMVLLTESGYFAYGTDGPEGFARQQSGREFPVLRSSDLTNWKFVGGALEIPPQRHDLAYWAPEVAEREGKYFLYYSSGGAEGEEHQIRVATSDHPSGPFVDSQRVLMPDEPFTIDAHPFRDPVDGKWYLFFAKDFFDEPSGTGIAVGPLSDDMMSIDGQIAPLFRGQAAWHVFERDRFWYDRSWPVWYCVEGPFVVYRDGKYQMFYSGGNWHAANYGVGCAVADAVMGPYVDRSVENGPSVLMTMGELWGPGHCSIVSGPQDDDRICFHAWDADYIARRMHLRKLEWASRGPKVQ